MKRRLLSGLGVLVVFSAAAWALLNRQWLRDSYIVRSTTLQPASEALRTDIELTSKGDFIYKASQAAVEEPNEFNQACRGVAREQSIVLGCYTKQRMYMYNVKDQRLNGVKQVTAAHELLHAVYERMPESEQSQVNNLLESTAAAITDQRFKDTMAEYRRTEPGQINNELHSIIGTEIDVIPEQLEQHYQKYLQNRTKIVRYAKQYEQTFTGLDDEIKGYDAALESLEQQKLTLESSLQVQQSSIEAQNRRLEATRASGDINGYNNAVPVYNNQIREYNLAISKLKQIVANYNEIVKKRNTLATTQNDLAKQLDSNYQPL